MAKASAMDICGWGLKPLEYVSGIPARFKRHAAITFIKSRWEIYFYLFPPG